MRRLLQIFLPLLLLVPAAHALRVSGLHEAEVTVPDQSNSARVQGVINALRTVIIKLTGDASAPERAAAAPILRAAERYLLQYRYDEIQRPGVGDAAPVRELQLWVQFGREALERDLRGAGLPIWGADRPSTLAWVSLGGESGWRWAGADGGPDSLQTLMESRARTRGLGLMFPLHDLDDSPLLTPAAALEADADAVRAASERYRPDTVLVGAIDSPAPGSWRARWSLSVGPEVEQWSNDGPQLDQLVRDGVNVLADHLARRFAAAGAGAEEGGIVLQVHGVDGAAGYARALRYLQTLNSVTDVQVGEVSGDMVTFVLSAYGGAESVRQSIALGRVLTPAQGAGNSYRLQQ